MYRSDDCGSILKNVLTQGPPPCTPRCLEEFDGVCCYRGEEKDGTGSFLFDLTKTGFQTSNMLKLKY